MILHFNTASDILNSRCTVTVRVFKNTVLRKILVTKDYWGDQVKWDEMWEGHVVHVGEKRNTFRILVEKP
jgi:hypothetical protein